MPVLPLDAPLVALLVTLELLPDGTADARVPTTRLCAEVDEPVPLDVATPVLPDELRLNPVVVLPRIREASAPPRRSDRPTSSEATLRAEDVRPGLAEELRP